MSLSQPADPSRQQTQGDDFARLVAAITGGHRPRVWSLLVSVFGDLAQQDGARISGQLLGALSDRMGIRPEAVRVALHRLRRDGWITSDKDGRLSYHRLSDYGLAQSRAASPRIYGAGSQPQDAWLTLYDPSEGPRTSDAEHGIRVSASTLLTRHRPDQTDAFVTHITSDTVLPDWMRNKVCDQTLATQSQALVERFSQTVSALPATEALSSLQIAALRVLVVHEWRRVALKAPDLPDFVFPSGWQGPACRKRVSDLLRALPKPDLADLEAALD